MAPRRGRRAAPAAARLSLLGLALLALALGVPRLVCARGPVDEANGEAGVAAAEVAPAADAPARAAAEPARTLLPAPRAGALDAPLAAIARRWVEEARRRSRGVAGPENVRVSVCVRDTRSGVELAALDADRALRPASNMKLVTTAAALVLLGPGAEFQTPVEAGGPIEGGVLRGDLVLRAGGDPLVAPQARPWDGRVEHRLAALAREIAAGGVRRVAGDLVLDEDGFPDPGPGPGWPDASQHWTEYCARVGGFSVNGGVLVATVVPGRAGAVAEVDVRPAPHGLRSRYGVRTLAADTLDVRVGATVTTVTVQGEIAAGRGPFLAEFSHPDPVALFASVLRAELARAGVDLAGGVRRERGAAGGPVIAVLRSPVADALEPINTDSRNGVADQLFLALGLATFGQGSREAGRAATAGALERLGVASAGLVQVDGSGLSRDDRASARQIAALVAAVLALEPATALAFVDSLAVAGRTGTLAERMRGAAAQGRVFAKTGWISGASALSGVANALDGRELVFSILVAYPAEAGGLNSSCFKPMQDEMVALLVEDAP